MCEEKRQDSGAGSVRMVPAHGEQRLEAVLQQGEEHVFIFFIHVLLNIITLAIECNYQADDIKSVVF